MSTNNQSIYERVTNEIVEALQEGTKKGKLPWHTTVDSIACPMNAKSKTRYRGLNVIILWITAHKREYPTGQWATYKQWRELGAQVRKGEKASHVVFWSVDSKEDTEDEVDGTKTSQRVFARDYSVFNAVQVEGYTPRPIPKLSESERIESTENFIKSVGAEIQFGGNQAFYSVMKDCIYMPEFCLFRRAFGYYSILSHELTHWTGATHRLNRQLGKRFGSEAYAMEELIAELGAAFLCAHLEIVNERRKNHASYIASWINVLQKDSRAIFTAASQAQKAVDWMLSLRSEKNIY